MEIRYHPVSHDNLSPTVKTVEPDTTARFLGQTYFVRRPIYQPYREKLNLVYRGVAYSTGNPATALPQSSPPSIFVAQLVKQLGI